MKTLLFWLIALFSLQTVSATEINVTYSDDFSKTLEKIYGVREGRILTKDITDDLTQAFLTTGVDPARVDIVILNAKPNRPTMQQISHKPGLDMFRSVSIGGMKLRGTAYNDAGDTIATQEYEWFESSIRHVQSYSTWSNANRASRRFAQRFAHRLDVTQSASGEMTR